MNARSDPRSPARVSSWVRNASMCPRQTGSCSRARSGAGRCPVGLGSPALRWQNSGLDWLSDHKVSIAPTRLVVRYAMLTRTHWFEVRYSFDPAGFGGDTLDQKAQEAMRWAEQNLATVRSGLMR